MLLGRKAVLQLGLTLRPQPRLLGLALLLRLEFLIRQALLLGFRFLLRLALHLQLTLLLRLVLLLGLFSITLLLCFARRLGLGGAFLFNLTLRLLRGILLSLRPFSELLRRGCRWARRLRFRLRHWFGCAVRGGRRRRGRERMGVDYGRLDRQCLRRRRGGHMECPPPVGHQSHERRMQQHRQRN